MSLFVCSDNSKELNGRLKPIQCQYRRFANPGKQTGTESPQKESKRREAAGDRAAGIQSAGDVNAASRIVMKKRREA